MSNYGKQPGGDRLISRVTGVITQIEGDFVKIKDQKDSMGMLHRMEFENKALIAVGQQISYLLWRRPNGSQYYKITQPQTPQDKITDRHQLQELLGA